jgi:hypothetical protein
MSDPLRTEGSYSQRASSLDRDTEREAKIEALLLSGLDHYFAADYSQAIDVWTRALFLDRHHARARAYIERARSAQAETQRESEELLHNGVTAFERGDIEAARRLLDAAVKRGGAHEVALAFLTRIDRLSVPAAVDAPPVSEQRRVTFTPVDAPAARRTSLWVGAALLAFAIAATGAGMASWDELRTMVALPRSSTAPAPVRPAQDPLLVPRSSEIALERARGLFASGRPYDALRALDLVRPTDAQRADADALKADIQRELLAHANSMQP